MLADKVLIVCGPTASGKTSLALKVAEKFNGEIVSADSRQVYKTMNIVTGKDLSEHAQFYESNIIWRDRKLGYYIIQGIKVWLYDIVSPEEEFNVSYWHECASLVIQDIVGRGKRPIVTGGTGLYIKSLTSDLQNIIVPPDTLLRNKLSNLDHNQLFNYLKSVDVNRANGLNESDRKNPRRLIRAIEISQAGPTKSFGPHYDFLFIGLNTSQIENKIAERINKGARQEFEKMHQLYSSTLPSMTAAGYGDWNNWVLREKQYAKRQLTWFKKESRINWLTPPEALILIKNWYN